MIENLMIVDDNAIDQKLYRRIVERSNSVETLHAFVSAERALEFLRQDNSPKIDAILLDIHMPRMDGFEFLDMATREFGTSFAAIAVILMTTSASQTDKARAAKFAAVKDYINKPLTTEHLRHIDAILN